MTVVRIDFHDQDREVLREIGTLLDQLDAAIASDDVATVSNLLTSARLTYLGGFCVGLADREPTFQRYPGDEPRPIPHGPSEPEQT